MALLPPDLRATLPLHKIEVRRRQGTQLKIYDMTPRVKDYAHRHQTHFNHEKRGDSKEWDRIANVCVMRATEALKVPVGTYSQMHCHQMADVFRSMMATQRAIRRMLDFEGPIVPETVDALILARVQLEGLFSLCVMLEDSVHVSAYVQDHWRKQYVRHLLIREETQLLPQFQELYDPEVQRLVMLGKEFGIGAWHLYTVDNEELGTPMPAGVPATPIHPFPTPGKVIKKISSSSEKKRMLQRLYAEYGELCSFAHGLPQANLFKNLFDVRFQARRVFADSEIKNSYMHQVASPAYLTSFMSIAQSTAELTTLYPNNMELFEVSLRAWKVLAEAS